MDDGSSRNMTPEEVGAFVAQWSERHPTTVQELASRLDVDAAAADSLLNQSKGRLSMEKWMTQKGPSAAPAKGNGMMVAAGGIGGLLLGGILVFLLGPKTSKSTPAAPTVSFGVGMMPPQASPSSPRAPFSSNGVGFHPVAGDGDPAQRIGLAVGSDIARSTTLPEPKVAVHRASFVATPGPGMRDINFAKTVPMHSATAGVEALGVHLPDDLVISLETPSVILVAKGKASRNPDSEQNRKSAQNLKVEDISKVLNALVAYALTQSPLAPDSSEPATVVPRFQIRLRLGNVSQNLPIQWITSNKDHLASMFKGTKDPSVVLFLQSFIGQVRHLGLGLFAEIPMGAVRTPAASFKKFQ